MHNKDSSTIVASVLRACARRCLKSSGMSFAGRRAGAATEHDCFFRELSCHTTVIYDREESEDSAIVRSTENMDP